MAINPNTNATMTGRITAPTTAYPYGSSRDETSPGAGDGTPYFAARANDIFGFQQALLRAAGIVPSGSADTATASQYMQAIVELASGRAKIYDESGAANAYVLDLRTNQQAPAAYFDGMTVTFTPGNINTGASTVNVAGLGVKDIRLPGGIDPIAKQITGRTTLVFDLANDWFELQNKNGGITGSATFTNSTNNIALPDVGVGVEIGDVIQVSGTVSNDGEFTIEVITDDDNVIVNQAHAGGTTTKSLTDETIAAEIKLLCKWYQAPVGLGQGWVNMGGSRALSVTYTNTTKRTICMDFNCVDSGALTVTLAVNGTTITSRRAQATTSPQAGISNPIPSGDTYRATTSSGSLVGWWELR